MKKAFALFVFLTIVATWPQTRYLATRATPHQDVFFNMWRLRWFAHALVTPGAHLFDANIFYPEKRTLALSDAILVEDAIAAPLVWARLPPVLVHNLLLLGAIALSGAAIFALAVYLTGSRGAGVLAGIVFAYAPFRFEHYMHMEMQWAMWMPLAFLALHRTLDTGKLKYGLALGACIALQMLSSIYYGIFLALLIAPAALLLMPGDRGVPWRRLIKPLAAGAAVAVVVSAIYAIPYRHEQAVTGERGQHDVLMFSAEPISYLIATHNNWLYGGISGRGRPERRLFPGTIAIVLALIGLLAVRPSRRSVVYLLLAAVSFELSLGFGGYSFAFLYKYISVLHGLRALARLGIFVLMFLAVLAAYGYVALVRARPRRTRIAILTALAIGMLVEYHVTLTLEPYANAPAPVYRLLARNPPGVVAEFPVPKANVLPGFDAEYAYMSTFDWFPRVNGYSGMYPPSYLERLHRLRNFPDDESLRQLRADHVRYVIVHAGWFTDRQVIEIRRSLEAAGIDELAEFGEPGGYAILFKARELH